MNVDTETFTALAEQVAVMGLAALAAEDAIPASEVDSAAARTAYRRGFTAGLRHAGVLRAQAGRHARPRSDRHGLRLVAGGDARA